MKEFQILSSVFLKDNHKVCETASAEHQQLVLQVIGTVLAEVSHLLYISLVHELTLGVGSEDIDDQQARICQIS